MADYKEQLDRTRRWLQRIENKNAQPTEYLDFMIAFFQNCWHLKDWIKNDVTLKDTIHQTIETEAAKYNSLMICADVANRTKHLVLKKNIRLGAELERHVNVTVNACKEILQRPRLSPRMRTQWMFLGGSNQDALGCGERRAKELGSDSLRLWTQDYVRRCVISRVRAVSGVPYLLSPLTLTPKLSFPIL